MTVTRTTGARRPASLPIFCRYKRGRSREIDDVDRVVLSSWRREPEVHPNGLRKGPDSDESFLGCAVHKGNSPAWVGCDAARPLAIWFPNSPDGRKPRHILPKADDTISRAHPVAVQCAVRIGILVFGRRETTWSQVSCAPIEEATSKPVRNRKIGDRFVVPSSHIKTGKEK